jgi:cytochrome c-type biogenesis protein CcmH
MTPFIVAAVLLVLGALLFILPPLLRRKGTGTVDRSSVNAAVYRDQLRELDADLAAGTISAEGYEQARRELEARVLQDVAAEDAPAMPPARARATAVAAGIAVPVVATLLYLLVGMPQALSPETLVAGDNAHAIDEQQLMAMVEKLAERMKENPDNADGWVMLARSYSVIGRFGDSANAYKEAVARIPDSAQLLADYADALAMAQDRNLQGEPEKLVARALRIDPDNVKARALAGTIAFDRKNYAEAVTHWEHILKTAPPDSKIRSAIQSSIAEAQALGGMPVTQAAEASTAQPAAPSAQAAGNATVTGIVKLAPQLAAKVAPDDILFIYARAAEGPRAPLAILRKPARELPAKFTLDDSMAMNPALKLSSFQRVVIAARVSKTGNAMPQPGDLQGSSSVIASNSSDVTIVIDSEVR